MKRRRFVRHFLVSLLLFALIFQTAAGCGKADGETGRELSEGKPPTVSDAKDHGEEDNQEADMEQQEQKESEKNTGLTQEEKESQKNSEINQEEEKEPEKDPDDIEREFIHPGILNSAGELEIMKRCAVGDEACEPWASAYQELLVLVESYYQTDSSNFISQDALNTTRIVRSNCGGGNDMRRAASKVYNLAVAYHISENERYAKTAREIMMHYAEQFQGVGSKTDGGGLYDCNLASGVIAQKFCSAAEILCYDNYEGWSEEDRLALIAMFNRCEGEDTVCSMARLLDWTNDADGLMSQYDMNNLVHGHAAFANFGAIAYAVFAEDSSLYNRVVRTLTAEVSPNYSGGTYSWERKALAKGTGGAIAYNINPENGQNKEMDRDITHSLVMLSGLVTIAQIAHHQGDDSVYECHDRLLLKGVECMAKYNLGYDVESVGQYPWNHFNKVFSTYNRGGAILKDPMFEAAYNYYFYQSEAEKEDLVYLQELVNNQTLSPEIISEDVTGMGTLLYSNEDRKNFYAGLGERKENTESEIYAENYMALVENAVQKEKSIVVTGTKKGVIAYRTPDWETGRAATKELGIAVASNTAGYVEFRLQSKDGTGYGQALGYLGEAGNSGTLLARIEVPDTGGETVYLKGTVYDTEGNYGGRIVLDGNKQILYLVVGTDTEDGEISYRMFTTRPNENYILSGGKAEDLEDVSDEPRQAWDIKLYQYGWTGSGVDFMDAGIYGWDDGDITSSFRNADGEDICPNAETGVFGADRYLVFDLGARRSLASIKMFTENTEILSGAWAVYGANEMDSYESTWTLLADSTKMELTDHCVEVAVGEAYRYLMIGGYGTGDGFMNTWVHCWDSMTEIIFYGGES